MRPEDWWKPMISDAMKLMADQAVKSQKQMGYDEEWKKQSISIEDAHRFMKKQGKTGIAAQFTEREYCHDLPMVDESRN